MVVHEIEPKFQRLSTVSEVLQQDLYHMATQLGENVLILHHSHKTEKANYILVVDLYTGQEVKISFK